MKKKLKENKNINIILQVKIKNAIVTVVKRSDNESLD